MNSFIATVFNEEKSIIEFINSVLAQSTLPDEVIIVDGGSSDSTVQLLKKYSSRISIYSIKGNRSVGRNYGVKKAKGDVLLFSDAGCILDKYWVEEITKPFEDHKVDAVAGYYSGRSSTAFEQALIPYVLVMPDNVNPETFLPATRSMAIRKKFFWSIGGFDSNLSHNEDYVFSRRIKKSGGVIIFAEKAIVNWIPRSNIIDAYRMFYRFAYGDAESGTFRVKVFLLFMRYILGFITIIAALYSHIFQFAAILLFFTYIIWAIVKNWRYVHTYKAALFLPILQLVSDAAVIKGTLAGVKSIMLSRLYELRRMI